MSKVVVRERKSSFVKLFDKTPPSVLCPHFYELILSNGCPFDCDYCYLRLTFRGKSYPTIFDNEWKEVRKTLDASPPGVYNTGELADSLAICPPLLENALDYFATQHRKFLLLVTKSTNTGILRDRCPSSQVIISFSINSSGAARTYETEAPAPEKRLRAASELKAKGWRVRIRLDPIILESGLEEYRDICHEIQNLDPERVTIGSLRQYPGLHNFSRTAPRRGLMKAPDGRLRYSVKTRVACYETIAEWLGSQPALCKETYEVWANLGWHFSDCNCTR